MYVCVQQCLTWELLNCHSVCLKSKLNRVHFSNIIWNKDANKRLHQMFICPTIQQPIWSSLRIIYNTQPLRTEQQTHYVFTFTILSCLYMDFTLCWHKKKIHGILKIYTWKLSSLFPLNLFYSWFLKNL